MQKWTHSEALLKACRTYAYHIVLQQYAKHAPLTLQGLSDSAPVLLTITSFMHAAYEYEYKNQAYASQ